ncbi:Hypothetical protein, putative [Bodo saltans]|uniref:Uncharacterized protein n=1 Tax=Bodo saltans TaxID=75058 RepID=A0A0S4JKU4_BODSA|nr:Hypothetical protein, putative [Bodo saltans]|eukprot:CUG90848.1 Hypothetical protein, putative [Bodo saltans]
MMDNNNIVAVNQYHPAPKKLSVCVLCSSYEGSESELKQFDDLRQSPHWYFDRNDTDVTFEIVELKKATVYKTVRALIKSGKYDVFYNQCDGAKDEDRAGEEVIRVLEEFKVPFTAAMSNCYELSSTMYFTTSAMVPRTRTAPVKK